MFDDCLTPIKLLNKFKNAEMPTYEEKFKSYSIEDRFNAPRMKMPA
jgi:hypothetical protein